IVITGEVGTGKTTLVRNLLRKVSNERVRAAQIVSTQVDADDLLRLAAGGFGIESQGITKSELLLRLEAHFRALHAEGRRALLIVDEAQNLSPRAVEELRMLSNFQVENRSLVQSFLVGQPEFRQIMQHAQMSQLKQRILASYHLGPLDLNETQAYIEHRLRHVGWRNRPGFDAESFERIFSHTAGVPRRINALCDRVLLASFLAERTHIEPQHVDECFAELAEELGPSRIPTPGGAPGNGQIGVRGVPGAGFSDGSWETGESGSAELGLDRFSALEDRLAMLEASQQITNEMLRKVLRAIRGEAASGVEPATGRQTEPGPTGF
ncbi:MAG: AAA family ATPase, partial [Burkholderiaceae bacterium]|nr:AAA family ATPase [Burkholderiaceae bacterium]